MIYHAQQKSVDMKIGLDIASMAYKKQVNKIIYKPLATCLTSICFL
jgi:hypothetical protein